MNGSRVPLPANAERPFQVFVNGVPTQEGVDFEVRGADLVFHRGGDRAIANGLAILPPAEAG